MFPGLYCPGLIEATGKRQDCVGGGWFPGLYCPGLIEASRFTRMPCLSTMFPGLYCPGLIEAAWVMGEPLAEGDRFRGSIAPASLKPWAGGWPSGAGAGVSGALLPRPH